MDGNELRRIERRIKGQRRREVQGYGRRTGIWEKNKMRRELQRRGKRDENDERRTGRREERRN